MAAGLLLAGCGAGMPAPDPQGHAGTSPLATHRFAYRGTASGGHTLSPDGNKLAWFGPSLWRRTLFVRDRRSGKVASHRARAVEVRWSADSRWLLYESDNSGAENYHVWAIDTGKDGSEAVDLTPHPGIRASIQRLPESEPGQVLVQHNRRNPRLFDLYRIDLASRTETMVGRNPGDAVAPIFADDGTVRGWQRSRESARRPPATATLPPAAAGVPAKPGARLPTTPGTAPQALPGADPHARPGTAPAAPSASAVRAIRAAEDTVRILGPGPDAQVLWALSNRNRDRSALVALQSRYAWEQVVAEDPDVDIAQAVISRVTRTPLLVTSHPGYPRTRIPDAALKHDLEPLLKPFAGQPVGIEILGTDRTERRLLVRLYTSTRGHTWLIDRDAGTSELLDSGDAEDFSAAMSPMQPVALTSRDGLTLRGFLTLPKGAPPRGLPMVLLVHGGPWSHTRWVEPARSEDSTRAQFLANRGYAVLQIDFRGSTGYGKRFLHAAAGEFAGRMQDDLTDAVQWAVGQGIADPARVAIMGLSYGGYAALVGLAATPRAYACGISVGGPTDLATLIETFPPYWKTDLTLWHDFVGNPKIPAERADMTRRSPLPVAANIERPVLLIHGGRDVRVRPEQSQRMADAMTAHGRPVRLVMLPEMGHNPSWWAHHYQVLRETETFLAACLGGRDAGFDWFDPLVWVWTRLSR